MWLAFLPSFHKVQISIRLHECRLHNILKTNLSFFLWRHSRALCLLRSSLFFGLPFFPFRPLPPLSRFRKKLETVGSFLSYCRQKTMKELWTGMPFHNFFPNIKNGLRKFNHKKCSGNQFLLSKSAVKEIDHSWLKQKSCNLFVQTDEYDVNLNAI